MFHRFAVIGLGLGPGLLVWYKFLERVIGKEQTLKATLKKVALDQTIFAPVGLFSIMGAKSLLDGRSLEEFKTQLSNHYPEILVNNYKVWPAVQILNFSIVPLQFRVLIVQLVALGWNTYLALRLHNSKIQNMDKV